jgi:indole-3-glycerol phosphate synthase
MSLDALQAICAYKRDAVKLAKKETKFAVIDERARAMTTPTRGFAARLNQAVGQKRFGLIAEMKRASPSGGTIRPDFDPAAIAASYERAGASCLSVLTDGPSFQGMPEDLAAAKAACNLPILRKDFMIDPWQIAESRLMGADCVLLIMACMGLAEAAEMAALAGDYGMDVLAEVHAENELEKALSLPNAMIGINNRNLKTLKTDLATTEQLAGQVTDRPFLISESGIKTHADVLRLSRAGAYCFLVGESLLREADLEAATRRLLQG